MSEVLAHTSNPIISTDLHDRSYGDTGVNYLAASRRAANVITNPPYNSAEGFVATGLEVAERKFALLLRQAFLEGTDRRLVQWPQDFNPIVAGSRKSRPVMTKVRIAVGMAE